MKEATVSEAMLSIGALSRATGIAVETLRTWERRYDFPQPIRRESGHRRYPLEVVQRLRLVRRALDLGHRPSTVVAAEPEALRSILQMEKGSPGALEEEGERVATSPPKGSEAPEITGWLQRVEEFDGDALEQGFRRAWMRHGAQAFITRVAAPFLRELGRRWDEGSLNVRHEHFASERLHDFLVGQWRPLSDAARGRYVLCATLSGEHHTLGLHLSAVILSLAEFRVAFLGASLPAEEIARACRNFSAVAVVIANSPSADLRRVRQELEAVRARLPGRVPLLVGGGRATPNVEGVTWLENFDALAHWAREAATEVGSHIGSDSAGAEAIEPRG